MAIIKNGFLSLCKEEIPAWWIENAFVKIVAEKKDDFFLWYKKDYVPGCYQINKNGELPISMKAGSYQVIIHSDASIRIMTDRLVKRAKKAQDYQKQTEEYQKSTPEYQNNPENYQKTMSNKEYADMYKNMIPKLLNGEITTRQFEVLTDRIHKMLQDWDLFNEPEQKKVVDLESTLSRIISDPKSSESEKMAAIKLKLSAGFGETGKKERKTIVLEVNKE